MAYSAQRCRGFLTLWNRYCTCQFGPQRSFECNSLTHSLFVAELLHPVYRSLPAKTISRRPFTRITVLTGSVWNGDQHHIIDVPGQLLHILFLPNDTICDTTDHELECGHVRRHHYICDRILRLDWQTCIHATRSHSNPTLNLTSETLQSMGMTLGDRKELDLQCCVFQRVQRGV